MGPRDTSDERRWVERARAGDRAAFSELVRRHHRAAYAMAMRFLRDHDDADDVAQRAFLRAWEALPRFEGRCEFRTWVLGICLNLCRNHHRDRRRFLPESAAGREPSSAAVGTERLEREEAMARVRDAVAALPEKQRMAVELRVYQALPFKEVAAAMETTENAAKVNFHYAVQALKARVSGAPLPEAATGRG